MIHEYYIKFIQSNMMMVLAALSLRALQGFSRVLMQVPSFSMLFLLFPQEKLKYVGLMESALNIGTAIGPVIGSVLYNFVGYFYMFIIFGLSFVIYIPILLLLMPSDLNSDQEDSKSMLGNTQSRSIATKRISL